MMRIRSVALSVAVALSCALSSAGAFADDAAAQSFVEREHGKLMVLLHEAKTPARDEKIAKALDAMVDYDELTKRAFGQPCPKTLPACVNYYGQLSAEQQATLRDLLRQLVDKNYRTNLEKTLDYDVSYKGTKDDADGRTRVRTEAKSKAKPRDPAVQVDYVVREDAGKFFVVDIVTEGSSLTKNDYVQFDKKFKAHAGDLKAGYEEIVAKLKEKIAKP